MPFSIIRVEIMRESNTSYDISSHNGLMIYDNGNNNNIIVIIVIGANVDWIYLMKHVNIFLSF